MATIESITQIQCLVWADRDRRLLSGGKEAAGRSVVVENMGGYGVMMAHV